MDGGYLVKALRGEFSSGLSIQESESLFQQFQNNPYGVVLWTGIFFVLTMLVVRGGIRGGIERASKILMPAFFVLLAGLALRSVTLPGAEAGVRFLFDFDLSKITPTVVLSALAQALFSMSLGMGAMITYGSYLAKDENLPKAGWTVALFDAMIALLAGLMIFPAIFAAGGEPRGEEGLVFVALPTIIESLPAGQIFGLAFYCLLVIAALTSSISLLEVVVSYFVDERGWSRTRSTWLLGSLCFLLAVPSAASSAFMGIMVKVFWVYSLSIGALMICLFVGWKWGTLSARREMEEHGASFPGLSIWGVLVKYVCPVVAGLIILSRLLGY